MKKTAFVLVGFLLLQCSNLLGEEAVSENSLSQKSTLSVLSSPELYNLAAKWATEYQHLYPGREINIINSGNTGTAGLIESGASFGIVSGEHTLAPQWANVWKMAVGRDIIVPVINSENPFLQEISLQGVTSEEFARIISDQDQRVWGNMIENGQNFPVHLYILNDATAMAAVKDFLNLNQFPAEGIYYKSAEEIIASVQNDPYAVGFCKMVNIINPATQGMVENISLLPIDKNGNGKIDHMEKIFDNLDAFARGVWIGKYPRSLYRDVYVVSLVQPENESETALLKWILSDGQQFLYTNGLSNLVYGERQSKLDKFNEINIIQPTSKAFYFLTPLVFIILASLILLSLVISVIAYYRKNRKVSAMAVENAIPLHFTGNTVNIPKGLYYDKTHTWAFMEKDGMVKMGIDDFLQHVTGPITRIQMRKAGEKIRKGDMVLTIIQNGKRLIVFAPVSGTIIENNKILAENSSVINSSPYSDGWVYRIEPTNWLREIQFLDMAEKYKTWLNNEFARLKDFLAVSIKVDKSEYENVVLQDGGILKDNILEEFGPEVWEDFQVHFMDPKC